MKNKTKGLRLVPRKTTDNEAIDTEEQKASTIIYPVAKVSLGKDTFAEGFKNGFEQGLQAGKAVSYEIGFAHGVRHIVSLAEGFLIEELGLPNRKALAESAKIPAWWMLTLMTNFTEAKKT